MAKLRGTDLALEGCVWNSGLLKDMDTLTLRI